MSKRTRPRVSAPKLARVIEHDLDTGEATELEELQPVRPLLNRAERRAVIRAMTKRGTGATTTQKPRPDRPRQVPRVR